ncbi:MAG: FAD-dependent oxidoreductase [Candidatus Hydrogenedentota bacterium]
MPHRLITMLSLALSVALIAGLPVSAAADESVERYDAVVYGATSGGVTAAVQAARMDRSVAIISVNRHIGGMSSAGLGQTDTGRMATIGGLSREFYERVYQHYESDEAWTREEREEYLGMGPGEHEWYFPVDRVREWGRAWRDGMAFTFEPHVALKVFKDMLDDAGVTVVLEERLDLDPNRGVVMDGAVIEAIVMESGRRFEADVFVDATYEGDLMATAGVSHIVGREGNEAHGENLNGVQTENAVNHQFQDGVDPYVEPGDPDSGLLPGLDPTGPGEEGGADHRVQAYCFRMCLTDDKDNQVAFEKPAGYDEAEYELLFRNFEAGEDIVPLHPARMPNRKTDTNNHRAMSTNWVGRNYEWPDGDYETREALFEGHKRYQQGLMWTLANHPRVPEDIREEVSRWGYAGDEFEEYGNWPPQLYIRVGRRMIGEYVVTETDIRGGGEDVDDAVAMGGYQMDSHNVQRYVDENGHARNEGDVQVGAPRAYPISYRAIIPQREEASNLLAPVAMSATHIAYGSIRMEPVFMKLGHAAGAAAAFAISEDVAIHDVAYGPLRERLLDDGQVLPQ